MRVFEYVFVFVCVFIVPYVCIQTDRHRQTHQQMGGRDGQKEKWSGLERNIASTANLTGRACLDI